MAWALAVTGEVDDTERQARIYPEHFPLNPFTAGSKLVCKHTQATERFEFQGWIRKNIVQGIRK